jgi:DNA-binding transcriptional regulator GbsR (MarR family)
MNQPMTSGNPAAQRFVERMGQFFEQDGFARIAGRILGHLMLQVEPQSLDALAADLQVSKASVSTNTRMLEGLGALERVTRAGDRRDYYQVADLMHERMLELRLERFRATQKLLEEGMRSGAATDAVVCERMRSFADFFEYMVQAINSTRARWQRTRGQEAER